LADLERLLALVRRELGAVDARVVPLGEAPIDDGTHLSCAMADGSAVEATFDAEPSDREAKRRRLEMLASTFDVVLEEGGASGRRSRPSVTVSLHEELVALTNRSGALNAIIIDANSPVVWGAAFPQGVVAQPPLASSPRVAEAPANDDGIEPDAPSLRSRSAVHAVRGWGELAALRKGKHLRKIVHGDGEGGAPVFLVAHSFASIYIVLVVFGAPFDELRAERAVVEALPRIERLVLALPPLDPEPIERGKAMAMRRPRRP
jgi:hypothetical protein